MCLPATGTTVWESLGNENRVLVILRIPTSLRLCVLAVMLHLKYRSAIAGVKVASNVYLQAAVRLRFSWVLLSAMPSLQDWRPYLNSNVSDRI